MPYAHGLAALSYNCDHVVMAIASQAGISPSYLLIWWAGLEIWDPQGYPKRIPFSEEEDDVVMNDKTVGLRLSIGQNALPRELTTDRIAVLVSLHALIVSTATSGPSVRAATASSVIVLKLLELM
jgi:hypothetical protein